MGRDMREVLAADVLARLAAVIVVLGGLGAIAGLVFWAFFAN